MREGGCSRQTIRRPSWPKRGTLAHRQPPSEYYLRIWTPVELLRSWSTSQSFNLSFPALPPALCANGRTAPQPSIRFSDSGNGPAAAGEWEAGATPVTGNTSDPSLPAPFTRVQLASLHGVLKHTSYCVSALCLFFQLYHHPSWEVAAPSCPGTLKRRGRRSGPGSPYKTLEHLPRWGRGGKSSWTRIR